MDTDNTEVNDAVAPTEKNVVASTDAKQNLDCTVSESDERQVISESLKNLHVTAPTGDEVVDLTENEDVNIELRSKKSVERTSKRHKGKRKKRNSRDIDACSNSSSSYADSVGLRTRHATRHPNFPPLITLSSDSGSESNSKKHVNYEVEDIKPFDTSSTKGKRIAHIKSDYLTKLASAAYLEDPDKASDNNSETSSNNSVITKVKRRAKKRNLVNKKAKLARKKYFARASLGRNKCLGSRNKLKRPFLRARGGHPRKVRNLAIKRPLRQLDSDEKRITRQCISQDQLILPTHYKKFTSPLVKKSVGTGKRGRPRKFKPEDMPAEEPLKDVEKKEVENVEPAKHISKEISTSSQSNENSDQSATNPNTAIDVKPTQQVTTKKKKGKTKIRSDAGHSKTLQINRRIKPFLQRTSCIDYIQRVSKCRECRLAAYNKVKKNQNSYCRFLEFRKLCYAKNGTILHAGFSLASEYTEEDRHIWLPSPDQPPDDLSIETAKALLVQVGDQFCDLIEHEKEALSLHFGSDKTITWKKIVKGVREMCDVCDTTLFNIHWVCPKCGLAVCIDCYKVRKQGIVVEGEESDFRGRDEYLWLLCNSRTSHQQEKLIMTQIVPGNLLWTMQAAMHRARDIWKISAYCKCVPHLNSNDMSKNMPTGICKQLMSCVSRSFSTQQNQNIAMDVEPQMPKVDTEVNESALKWLNEIIVDNDESNSSDDMMYGSCYESFASLKNMLVQDNLEPTAHITPATFLSYSIDDIIDCVTEAKIDRSRRQSEKDSIKLFNHRYPQPSSGRDPLPIRIFTTTESSIIHSEVPHSWLCNGRLLLLHQAQHTKNLELFQEQWKRGQPIMVMGVDKRLDMSIWHPDGFCRDFGEVKNDLVNCRTGAIIPNLPMKKFWEGFENFDKRLKDENGEYMLLKLKDWPPGEDFSEKLPKRFSDLMQGLPLPEYTHRDGIFNLAGRLPSWFVKPDLGPKMYNAYGSALYPTKGTTNLHLDISDAVNVMVYVGVPPSCNDDEHIKEALKAIDEGGCDSLMRERVRSKGVRPGALWHIYNARDADKIRDMLTKVAIERGEKLEAHHDPIHDQSWYIDSELRTRLYHEYGVEGYAIAQCLGDAVFIPAGAPHQVRNLHSCVKVAEDFVSPENIGHCFKLTQEFRHLSNTHTNHEDKLQIKNIIYHVVKDSLSHLLDVETSKAFQLHAPY